MPSIVGITCNPEKSKKEWESKVSIFQYWQIVAKYTDHERAVIYAKSYARAFNSTFVNSEKDTPAEWYVYHFSYYR